MYSYGIDIFVIDAFNKVILPKGNNLQEINRVLTRLTSFARTYNVLIFLVAHPTKMQKNDDGIYTCPTLYDVSGSADFRNQTHNGYVIYRYFDNAFTGSSGEVVFINNKTKWRHQGKIGEEVRFKYNLLNDRYYPSNQKQNNESMIPLIPEQLEIEDEAPF